MSTGSTADIAFLLLIFFMITTTFEGEKGIRRKLPEWEKTFSSVEVRKRNILPVLINGDNQVMIRGNLVPMKDIRQITKEFLDNPNHRPDFPESELKDIGIFKKVEVTRGVISIRCKRETTYENYLHVMNELEAAGLELKDEFSRHKFGKGFDKLNRVEQEIVKMARPCMISEAEPIITR